MIHEYVAEHAACGSGQGSHDDGHPKGVVIGCGECLLDARYGEHGQADGVEQEPGGVLVDELLAEYHHPDEGNARENEVDGVVHPEDFVVEHDVACRAAADSRNEAHDVGSEEVEALGGGEAYAGDGEGQRADDVENLCKCELHRVVQA